MRNAAHQFSSRDAEIFFTIGFDDDKRCKVCGLPLNYRMAYEMTVTRMPIITDEWPDFREIREFYCKYCYVNNGIGD